MSSSSLRPGRVPALTTGNYVYVVDKMNRANDRHKIISQGAMVHFIRGRYALRARKCWNSPFISSYLPYSCHVQPLLPKKALESAEKLMFRRYK